MGAPRSILPNGVSALSQGRGARLRSRPPDNTEAEQMFKLYLLMREKERTRRYADTLERTMDRSRHNTERIERELASLSFLLRDGGSGGAPAQVEERSPRPSRPTRVGRSKDAGGGSEQFEKVVVEY